MLRVGNLDRAIAFYTDVLGMKLLRRKDYPGGKFTLAFVGFQEETDGAVLELTYNWGVESYTLGTAYGHIAIEVEVPTKPAPWCVSGVAKSSVRPVLCSMARLYWHLLKIRTDIKSNLFSEKITELIASSCNNVFARSLRGIKRK